MSRAVSADVPTKKARWPRCVTCKEVIRGRKWRVEEGKYQCTLCHNEGKA